METSLLLVTVILSALVATSYSISCVKCIGLSGLQCSGPVERCPSADDACISMYTVIMIDGVGESKTFLRDCGNRSSCPSAMSLSNTIVKSRTGITCCFSDSCTPSQPTTPPEYYNKNGVRCKTCYDLSDKPCQTDEFMDCLGEEKKCISQVSSVKVGSSGQVSEGMRGCATQDMCNIRLIDKTFGEVTMNSHITCTDGTAGLHYNWLLLLISASLLLKFI
ncbi:phospholipase A2 inhibitor gamma subunit B-like [Pseudophryne corroboree]|uniref:phospholipase A2 inhibitor gamma subunit B-like n=1 Tax=Pseudophryne corroboree TaxID=495146 RepID=UPI003081603D